MTKSKRMALDAVGRDTIPAFLSVDVEPDAFQLSRSAPAGWPGYDAMYDFCERLRHELAKRSGVNPKFGWYFRTDPQIEEVYGRADDALVAYPERTARIKAHGDYLGVHAHPIRWCEQRKLWVHDFGDPEWLAHCTRFAIQKFSQSLGSPALRTRWGAGLLTNDIIKATEECGVAIDLTLEPVAGWGLTSTEVGTSVDTSPMDGPYTDCRSAPRGPYRPAHHDFRVKDNASGRRVLMVPLTTAPLQAPTNGWRGAARRFKHWAMRKPTEVRMMYPANEWPSTQFYWDTVERQLDSMKRPYLSLAIRTDADDLKIAARVRSLFEALPQHRLAERLRFVDPLEHAPMLM
jgi:hypothetical protein